MSTLGKRSKKSGLPPGTPVHVGKKKTEKVRITIIDYDRENYNARDIETLEEYIPVREKTAVTWVNVVGLHEVPFIEKLGNCFGIHPLTLEDILNTEQRPKMDMLDDYIFIVIKMHFYDSTAGEIKSEQVSIVFGRNFVLTFQEQESDVFDSVRSRVESGKGKIRTLGADYLSYTLLDSVVDNYFRVLEEVGEEIESMEDAVVENPVPATLQKIHTLKREIIFLRKSVWPLREIINSLEREESHLVKKAIKIYLRDLYDHTIQIIDTVETYRDIIAGMLDVYLSSISNKMNEVMKVLTIFAAIFIPLTFIAGIYGMNFNPERSPLNMPELNWYFGYPFALGLMAAIGITMIYYFKRKKWF